MLQYGDLQRIGDDTPLKVNVRILAATNRDLKQAVVEGQFRADLYHRLSVFPIHAPALRERPGDIPLLAGYFCERCRLGLGLEQLRIQPQALQLLERHDWPGNVRELEHAIHRAAVLARAEQGSPRRPWNPTTSTWGRRAHPCPPTPSASPPPRPLPAWAFAPPPICSSASSSSRP